MGSAYRYRYATAGISRQPGQTKVRWLTSSSGMNTRQWPLRERTSGDAAALIRSVRAAPSLLGHHGTTAVDTAAL